MYQNIQRWIVWFIVSLFVVYSFCLNTASAVFADEIKTTLHATDIGVSLAAGAFIFGFALMQLPAGYMLDKFNSRWVITTSVLILALGNIAISFTHDLPTYALANFVQGVGASFAFISAAVLISQWFSAKQFPIMFGLTQMISCISAGIIHYYFSILLQTYSWNIIYQCLAVFGLTLVILCLLLIRSPKGGARKSNLSLIGSLKILFNNKQIWLCSLAAGTSVGVLLAYASMWYMPVQQLYAVDELQAMIISGIIFLGLGVGTPIMGFISNYVKNRILVIHISLILGAMALMLGIYLPHFDVGTLIVTQIISFLIGFFISAGMLFYTMVNEMASNNTRGVAISILNTAVFLFNTLLLFIPYLFITNTSKLFFTNLWVLPFSIMIALLIATFIRDTYKNI